MKPLELFVVGDEANYRVLWIRNVPGMQEVLSRWARLS